MVETQESQSTHAFKLPVWYWGLGAFLVAIIALTAIPAFTQEPHAPGIGDFFPEAIFGQGTLFEFNRLTLARVVMIGLLSLFTVLAVRNVSRIPGRGQAVFELAAEFIRSNIAVEMLGNKLGRRYAPVLAMLFLGIFFLNISGVLPGINVAATSVIAVPMVFALFTYVTFIGAGIREQGFVHFFQSQLFPSGLPKLMYFIITPIEFLSNFIVRPVTLTLRLLCNMIAGHLLLGMTYLGTTVLLQELSALTAVSLFTGAAMVIMTGFEIFVAFLQAYIFTILSAVYIKLSVESH